jgi:hypothetical protein
MQYTTEGECSFTACENVFSVIDRAKPADYIYIETETEKDDIIEELKAYIDENIFGGEW